LGFATFLRRSFQRSAHSWRIESKLDAKRYYQEMLNGRFGLEDDLAANSAPDEAKRLLAELISVCRRDFEVRFLGDR
jgi:hypothetical protein